MGDLEDTQYFDESTLPDVSRIDSGENSSNDKGNEQVVEGGEKTDDDSSPPVHIAIP